MDCKALITGYGGDGLTRLTSPAAIPVPRRFFHEVAGSCRIRIGLILALLCGGRQLFAATPHYVFAHYMVCFATYGESIGGYQQEIREAQAAGIDGFALNVGAWDDSQPYYKNRVGLIFDAAEQLGTGFKLFFSVDFGDSTNIVQMVKAYAGRTNSFRYQGRLVLSAYGQNDVPSKGWPGVDWTNTVFPLLSAEGINVFFVPHFWPNPVQELPSFSDASNILQKYGGLLGGLFWFGAAGLPYQLAACNSNYTKALHNAGKISMASISPHYWGCAQPTLGRRYFETEGGEGLILQWDSILTNQPDWVQLTTWNDFNESTYFSPATDPGQYSANLQSPVRFCHSGYLELSKQFIAWFKSGIAPTNSADELFYFYRTHPKASAAANTNDVPVTWLIGDAQDTLFLTFYLTAPATLEVSSGMSSITNSFSTGWHNVRRPFSPGAQKLVVRRNGTPVIVAQGPDVQSQIQVYDFFPVSGFVYCKPAPPVNLRFQGN